MTPPLGKSVTEGAKVPETIYEKVEGVCEAELEAIKRRLTEEQDKGSTRAEVEETSSNAKKPV